jgi:carbon monoxide dehydrogenase subunit G
LELNQEIRINAPRERVFAALNDAGILQQAIPGCEEIEALSETEFVATVGAKVGPLKARFKGQVKLSDIVRPESYTLTGEGRGGPAGHAKVRANVRLVAEDDHTLLQYAVKADIGGKLAQLGGHLVQNTAQKLAAEFFRNFEKIVTAEDANATDATGDLKFGAGAPRPVT